MQIMKEFRVNIEVLEELKPDVENDALREYDDENDDIRSVFCDICDVLEFNPNIKFNVSGFGQEEWPVDVGTDLLTAVEELGEIVQLISHGNFDFEFYLYEQGVERKVIFKGKDDSVQLRCESYGQWQPEYENLFMEKEAVKKIFYDLKFSFCSVAEQVCPLITSHSWFKSWSGSVR